MKVLQMTQIIDIAMKAGEEVTTQLSFSTQMILLAIYIIAAVLLILKTIEIYKNLIAIMKENKEKEKRWERAIQLAEQQLNGIPTTSAEDYQQQKITFK